jgi:C1A family cysteine protease
MPVYPQPDYSEQHLADKNHGRDSNGLTAGGNEGMALAYLTRGGGPIAETDMPYNPSQALGRQISFPAKKWIREIQRNINEPWWTSGYKEFCQEHIYMENHGGIAGHLYFDQSIYNSDWGKRRIRKKSYVKEFLF